MSILKLQNVQKIYGEKENKVKALQNINLQVDEGEFVAIVGTSGSGKSTLLNLIGGLDQPTQGKIFVKNKEIGSLSRKELTIFRRRNIGFVFQNYSLMPVLNVYDNVALPVTFDRGRHLNRKYIEELLRELGIYEKAKKYPWGFTKKRKNIQTNYPADSSRELQSQEPWRINRLSCSVMNPQATWILQQPLR